MGSHIETGDKKSVPFHLHFKSISSRFDLDFYCELVN